ncbi:phosphate ABC transporter substrate-binding protein [Trinickia sp. NRRL B-1857]|uniref:phosphate ABC transporter substrate-binding protein n=1 Tax=Trinickia sp. NRRL B-1857 TaxID=3162879 RepID=UPI003D274B16
MRMLRSILAGAALTLSACLCHAELVVVVPAKSPVNALSENEVADIFLGRTSQVPGGGTVVPIDLADDAARRGKFYQIVCGKSPAQLRAYWSKLVFTGSGQPPREVADVEALKKLIAGGTNAIAYIDSGQLDASIKAVLTLH